MTRICGGDPHHGPGDRSGTVASVAAGAAS